jgi:hypothetical protein
VVPTAKEPGAPRSFVLLLSVTCAVTVANLYYLQPLLGTIAADLRTDESSVGFVSGVLQLGYAAGLLLIVPLGDIVTRRRLVPGLLAVDAVALAAMALAPSLAVLGIAAVAVGVSSVAVQILVPYAATVATEGQRNRVLSALLSAMLLGVLLSRVVAGLVAEAFGWRGIFAVGAGAMVVAAVTMWRTLDRASGEVSIGYVEQMRAIVELVRREPVLRRRSLVGAGVYGAFNVLWTTIAFLLAFPPFGFTEAGIGVFALVGGGRGGRRVLHGPAHPGPAQPAGHRHLPRSPRPVVRGARRRTRRARGGHPRGPRPRRRGPGGPPAQPEHDLRAARRGQGPHHHRLHDQLLRRRRRGFGAGRGRLRRRRVADGLRDRWRLRRGRPGRMGLGHLAVLPAACRAGPTHPRSEEVTMDRPTPDPRATGSPTPTVPSVRGPVPVTELGVTLMHEHVFVLSSEFVQNDSRLFDEERRVDDAVRRLSLAVDRGVRTLVDLTALGQGRYVPRVARVAARVDLNILVATGVYTFHDEPFHYFFRGPGRLFDGPDPMTETFVREIVDGIDDTGIRPAMLKCATENAELSPGWTGSCAPWPRPTGRRGCRSAPTPTRWSATAWSSSGSSPRRGSTCPGW